MSKDSVSTQNEIAAGAEFAKVRLRAALDRMATDERGGSSYGEADVTDYRAYIVGHDGHFKTFEVVKADDDKSAVEAARKYVDGHDVEVWDLDRKVAVLSHIK
jgi:hypothetical protein